MEEPTKSAIAEKYEEALTSYWANIEEATNRLQWRGRVHATKRWSETEEERAESFTEAIVDLERRVAFMTTALDDLKRASNLRAEGEPALIEHEHKVARFYEEARHRELHEANPEAYTLHAIAIKKAINTAERAKGVRYAKQTSYGIELGVYATINGLSAEEALNAVEAYIEARQMTYTLSTKNLKMKVA